MFADRAFRMGWVILIVAGCNGVLLPPSPPKMQKDTTAADQAAAQIAAEKAAAEEPAPRGPGSAPDHFKAKFETSKGNFIVQAHREWSPHGVDRFFQLIQQGFFDDNKLYRVIPETVAQFGISGEPQFNTYYQRDEIDDDKPVGIQNLKGRIGFIAGLQKNSRNTQMYINLKDNMEINHTHNLPVAEVIDGMDSTVMQFNSEYEDQPKELGGLIMKIGNVVWDERFPNLDYIIRARIIDPPDVASEGIKRPFQKADPIELVPKNLIKKNPNSSESTSPNTDTKPATEETKPTDPSPTTESAQKPDQSTTPDQPAKENDQPDPPKSPEPAAGQ